MKTPSQKSMIAAGFGLAWLILNAAGWGLGFGLQFAWMQVQMSAGLSSLMGVLLAAAVIGLAQWLGLRWLLPRLAAGSMGIAWVILTLFGYAAGFLGGSVVSGLVDSGSDPLAVALLTFVSWGLVGLTTGFLQWSLLQFAVRGAAWWIGANVVGYGLGAILLNRLRLEQNLGVFVYAFAGLVVGAATLAAIARLRRLAS
jgi:hypothetical protein